MDFPHVSEANPFHGQPVKSILPFILSMAILPAPAEEAEKAMPEYLLKAQFLIKLLSYVQWPPEVESTGPTFDLVVMGKSPFGSYLDDYVHGRTIRQRPIRIRYQPKAGDPGPCSVVFLCQSEAGRAGAVCAWARAHHVLTVSDDEALARQGVMVNFLLDGNFVRLAINPGATSAAGITLSSRVLKGARILPPLRPVS